MLAETELLNLLKSARCNQTRGSGTYTEAIVFFTVLGAVRDSLVVTFAP